MQERVVGIGMMHLRRRDFLGYEVPSPGLSTQQAVVNYLDWLEAGADSPPPDLPGDLIEARESIRPVEQRAAEIEAMRRRTSELEIEIDELVSDQQNRS
jgi:hypothetical protein